METDAIFMYTFDRLGHRLIVQCRQYAKYGAGLYTGNRSGAIFTDTNVLCRSLVSFPFTSCHGPLYWTNWDIPWVLSGELWSYHWTSYCALNKAKQQFYIISNVRSVCINFLRQIQLHIYVPSTS